MEWCEKKRRNKLGFLLTEIVSCVVIACPVKLYENTVGFEENLLMFQHSLKNGLKNVPAAGGSALRRSADGPAADGRLDRLRAGIYGRRVGAAQE